MPRLKRAGEVQLNKDAYEAEEDDRFAEAPDPGQGMTRASQEVMKKRRILRVTKRKGAGSGATAPRPPLDKPPAPSTTPAALSGNPFASTTLAQPAAFNKVGDVAGSNRNPFAKIAFASNPAPSETSAPNPKFSFTAPSSSAPKPAKSTFSFASTTTPSATIAAPSASVLSTPRSSTGKKSKMSELNKSLPELVVAHWEGKYYAHDYSPFMKEYLEHGERLLAEEGEDRIEPEGNADPGSTAVRTTNSQPAAGLFGAAAPAPSAPKPLSAGASSAPAAGTFSFAGPPAAAGNGASGASSGASSAPAARIFSFAGPSAAAGQGASGAPLFSFGAPSSSTGGAPSTANNITGDGNNDPTSNADDGKADKVGHEENSEEDVLYEVRAKHMKLEDKKWKKFGAGVLRLYRHKETFKQRMVIRSDTVGKVQFNVGVSKGMEFKKVIKDTKKGKACFVSFAAVENASKGVESFMLQVKPECVDKLHDTLEKMAKT